MSISDFFEAYIIVESEDDPTVKISKNFGYNVFVRKDLENKGK